MIRSAIRTEIQRLMDDIAGFRFTSAILNDWIDYGVVDMSAQLDLDTAQATFALVGSDTFASSEPNYQLPSNAVNIREVYIQDTSGNEQRFKIVEQDELAVLYGPSWRATTNVGVPIICYRADYNVLGVFPRPNAAYNGRTLRIFYDRMASAMASDTDTPIFITALHDGLVMYGTSRSYDLLGNVEKSKYYLDRYQAKIHQLRHRQLRFSSDMQKFRWT